MTLVLQCLSALTAFLSAESNATKLQGWQPAVICRIPNAQYRDTSIMDLRVLLNKWHNDCHDGRNWLHFYSSGAVQVSAAGQGRCRCDNINKRRIHIDDELMKRNGPRWRVCAWSALLFWKTANICSMRQRGHRPGSCVFAWSMRSWYSWKSLTFKSYI